jgi:hypothetical protein
LLIVCGVLLGARGAAAAAPYEPKWESLDRRACPEWFRDAKFGIFIYWGLYSVPSWSTVGKYAEWYWNWMHDEKPENVYWQFHTRSAGRSCQWSEGQRPGQQFGEFMVKYDLLAQVGRKPKGGLAVKQAFFTKKPGALYAITPGWPGKELVLRNVQAGPDTKVTLLGAPGVLRHKLEGGVLTIQTPDLAPGEAPCRHAYAWKITHADALAGE